MCLNNEECPFPAELEFGDGFLIMLNNVTCLNCGTRNEQKDEPTLAVYTGDMFHENEWWHTMTLMENVVCRRCIKVVGGMQVPCRRKENR